MNPLSDTHLDQLLRRSFEDQLPADDGYTAWVLRALPTRPRPPVWLLPGALLVGLLLAWLALVPASLWQPFTGEWLSPGLHAGTALICAVLMGIGLLSAAWALEEAG